MRLSHARKVEGRPVAGDESAVSVCGAPAAGLNAHWDAEMMQRATCDCEFMAYRQTPTVMRIGTRFGPP